MMAEKYRLGDLQVGAAGHDHPQVPLGLVAQRAHDSEHVECHQPDLAS